MPRPQVLLAKFFDSMMIIVTGASGLLGRQVYRALLASHSSEVTGLCFSRSKDQLLSLDLTNKDESVATLNSLKPSVIVHCAAERRPDIVEKKIGEAEALNLEATKTICDVAKENAAWVLYLSTDYVFDGKKAPYKTEDEPNPLNAYGRMKYGGERIILQCDSNNAVLRVPILYGPIESLDESAVTTLFSKVKDTSAQCIMDHYQRRFPTHTAAVADIISQMVTKVLTKDKVSGIYHFSEKIMMSKYDMASAMAEVYSISSDHIAADSSPPKSGTTRPYDCRLDTTRLENEGFILKSHDFKTSIKDCLQAFY